MRIPCAPQHGKRAFGPFDSVSKAALPRSSSSEMRLWPGRAWALAHLTCSAAGRTRLCHVPEDGERAFATLGKTANAPLPRSGRRRTRLCHAREDGECAFALFTAGRIRART